MWGKKTKTKKKEVSRGMGERRISGGGGGGGGGGGEEERSSRGEGRNKYWESSNSITVYNQAPTNSTPLTLGTVQ